MEAWYLLGLIQSHLKDESGELEAWRKVLELDPNHSAARENLEMFDLRKEYEKMFRDFVVPPKREARKPPKPGDKTRDYIL